MRNVILIGFMGTGKSSTGKMLAQRLGCAFIDMDNKIEEEAGLSIPEIFAKLGEDHFRQLEHELAFRQVFYFQHFPGLQLQFALGLIGIGKARNLNFRVVLQVDRNHGKRPVAVIGDGYADRIDVIIIGIARFFGVNFFNPAGSAFRFRLPRLHRDHI